jgi:hypothetical protein
MTKQNNLPVSQCDLDTSLGGLTLVGWECANRVERCRGTLILLGLARIDHGSVFGLLPRDMLHVIQQRVWATRFDPEWDRLN